MKRIISLIMSVLMIATMFCGFAVTSTAADGDPVTFSIVTSEVAEDGTFTAELWVKDNTEYGWYSIGVTFGYDEEKLELVADREIEGTEVFVNQSNMMYWMDEANVAKVKRSTKAAPSIANAQLLDEDAYELFIEPAETIEMYVVSAQTGSYKEAYRFDVTALEDAGMDIEAFQTDAEKGVLWATATFKVKDGAYGDAELSATLTTGRYGNDDNSDADYSATLVTDLVYTTTVDCGDEPIVEPVLPEGINSLVVDTEVSARTTENVPGLRFVSHADIDWTKVDVSEMGTAIVKTGTDVESAEAGVSKMMIPARVDYQNGEFLQEYTKDDNNIYTFIPGVKEDKDQFSYSGVISNIGDATMVFDAYAYVIVDGVTYYSAECVSACYNDVLGAASNDPYID